MVPAGSDECGENWRWMEHTCQELGVPLEMEKVQGPKSCLTILGMKIDIQEGILRFTADKLSHHAEDTNWSR